MKLNINIILFELYVLKYKIRVFIQKVNTILKIKRLKNDKRNNMQ